MTDMIEIVIEIEKILEQYDSSKQPNWAGYSDNKNKATAVFQKLRDMGALREE